MKNTEIKACPICGQQPTVTIGRRAGNGEWVALPMVRCKPCDYQKHGNSDDEAAAKWNERAGVRKPAMLEIECVKALVSTNWALLSWERQSEQRMRGYLSGHPENTLFILDAVPDGRVEMSGAFIPDSEENSLWEIQSAQIAAETIIREWVKTFIGEIAANAKLTPPPPTKD